MSGQTTMLLAASGAAIAATTGGPLAEVLNELALMTAIMGALGGATQGLSMKGFQVFEIMRGVALGALLAFGLGAAGPAIIEKILGLSISTGGTPAQILAVSSYIIGLSQDMLLTKIVRSEK